MENTPKIRFAGHTDDWEQRKVSEYANFFTGNGLNLNDISDDGEQECILYGNLYTDYGMITDNIVYRTNTKIKNPVYSEYGDVLIPASDTTPTGLARATSLEKSGVLLGGDINIIRPNEGINGSCLSLALNANRKELIRLIKGTTVRHIHNSEIKDIVICLPKLETEQVRISSYFKQLDRLITLHHRKLESLKLCKKYMLSKMFPKDGETVPEIRFEGFIGDWEQRKFMDFTWYAGKRNKEDLALEPYAITNEHGFIRQCEAHEDFGYMKNTDRKAYIIVQPNSFAYNPARINIGSIGYYEGTESVIVSSLYEVFQTDKNVNDRFLWHWFKSDEFPKWIEKLQEGSVRLYFYYDKLCECQLYIPSLEEQEKIATYFDNLDQFINSQQNKLDTLKQFKKYMLQNMFPGEA